MHEIDEMLLLQLEGKHTEARALSDKLERIGKDKILDPAGKNTNDIWLRHCFNRGWFITQEGDYRKGSQLLECGRFLEVYGSPPLKTDAPLYNPSIHNLNGKSIIISLEGGYGDEIIHARFATSFKKLGAKHVYLAASSEIVSVFSRIEGVDKVILRNQINTVAHDYWAPGFSAGWLAGHDFSNFPSKPYLTSDKTYVDKWKSIITAPKDKIKVGIRWAGNPKFEHQQYRRFPENFIVNLSKYPELQLFSLQKDHNLIDLPDNIVDLQHRLETWEDTLAAIENLDIVITSCTSIAHLAAALGKETWILVPILPYHTWTYKCPDNRTSPYYECVRLFRQTAKSKWNDTFQLLYKELEERFKLSPINHPNEDRVEKKLNLGCGIRKIDKCLNVDMNELVNPDRVVDLNKFPWPFEDNEFDHIIAVNVLEYLGETKSDINKILKEMYRISHTGAIWEIESIHHRNDLYADDPDIIRTITSDMFKRFDKMKAIDNLTKYNIFNTSPFDQDIDIEVVSTNNVCAKQWQEIIDKKIKKEEEIAFALQHFNNVITAVQYLVQVHKPGRVDFKEFNDLVEVKSKEMIMMKGHEIMDFKNNV